MAKVIKIRKNWSFNPKTRVKQSKKNYSRQKNKREIKELIVEDKGWLICNNHYI